MGLEPRHSYQDSGLSSEQIARTLQNALDGSFLDGVPCAIFHNLQFMCKKIRTLAELFPKHSVHALAIKANPLVNVLREAVALGVGLEAASMGEVYCGLEAGCPPERLVFDSPAKSMDELREALQLGIYINADNYDELSRIDSLFDHLHTKSQVGLRINPLVGSGKITMTSVAGEGSKFGVSIKDSQSILDAFQRYGWLTGLHVHVGSQGCRIDQLTEAVSRTVQLRHDINHHIGRVQVTTIDIGGGLPWAYHKDATVPTMKDYAELLRSKVPDLFVSDLCIVTEFGRSIQAGSGWAASQVEYIKNNQGVPKAVIHLGADFLVRPVYQPKEWSHSFSVLSADGKLKDGKRCCQTIVGPLCFAGDILAREVNLPRIQVGDWIVIHDVGAYTLSMWSYHCNRGRPLVLGYNDDPIDFKVLHKGETPSEVASFWS